MTQFHREDIHRIAQTLVERLGPVTSLEDLSSKMGMREDVSQTESMEFETRQSNPLNSGSAHTISYCVANAGIPVEVRVNTRGGLLKDYC